MITFLKNGRPNTDFHSILLAPYSSLTHLECHTSHLHSEFIISGKSTDVKGLEAAFKDEIPRLVTKPLAYSFQAAIWAPPHEFNCTSVSINPPGQGACTCKYNIAWAIRHAPSPAKPAVSALPWDEKTDEFDFHLCKEADDPLWRPNSGGKFWTYCKECGNWLKEFAGKRDDDLPF